MLLENLKQLKNDMQSKGWTICSFMFYYKEIEYIVLVKRFVGTEKRIDSYALVKLHFMKANNLLDELQVEANTQRLIIKPKTLREYFGIEYTENLGDILHQFTENLGKVIPTNMPANFSEPEKKAMVRSLSLSDSEDPNKIYCNKVRRNPDGEQRSEFNSDKTKLLRPSLFRKFCNDKSISFSVCRKTPICKQIGVKFMPNYAFAQKSRSITAKNEKNMCFLQLWIAYFLRFIAANLSLTQFVT